MSKGSPVKLSFWLQEGDIILLERLPPVCRIECRWYIFLNSTPHLLRAELEHILGTGKSIWCFFSILSSAEQYTFLQYFFFFQKERLFKIETSAKSMKQFIPNGRQEIGFQLSCWCYWGLNLWRWKCTSRCTVGSLMHRLCMFVSWKRGAKHWVDIFREFVLFKVSTFTYFYHVFSSNFADLFEYLTIWLTKKDRLCQFWWQLMCRSYFDKARFVLRLLSLLCSSCCSMRSMDIRFVWYDKIPPNIERSVFSGENPFQPITVSLVLWTPTPFHDASDALKLRQVWTNLRWWNYVTLSLGSKTRGHE